MSFVLEKSELIEGLKKLGARLCSYTAPGKEWVSRCDCKFGGSGKGEETGCAEIRAAVKLISESDDRMSLADVSDYARFLCSGGYKIQAIKLVRATTGMSLKDAKEFVDNLRVTPKQQPDPVEVEKDNLVHLRALSMIAAESDDTLSAETARLMRALAREALGE